MRKFFNSLILFATLSLAAVSCGDDAEKLDNKPVDETGAKVVMMQSGEAEEGLLAPSAEFEFDVKDVESYTYIVTTADDDSEYLGALVYADAEEIFDVEEDGTIKTTVYGLDGESSYKIIFVFKQRDKEAYVLKTATVTTADYNRTLNIIKVDPSEIRFHVKVDDDVHYRIMLFDYMEYYSVKGQYSLSDYDCFEMMAGMEVYTGSQTISIHDMDPYILNDGYEVYYYVKPSMQYVLMLIECDEKGVITSTNPNPNIYWSPKPTAQSSISVRPEIGEYCDKYEDKYGVVDGLFVRQVITAVMPEPAEGSVKITPYITERSARFIMSPSKEVVKYGYTFMPGNLEATLSAMPEGTDKEIYITSIMKSLEPCTDTEEAGLVNLDANTDYSLLVIYQSDEEGFTRGYEVKTFQTIVSTKPTIDLVITPKESATQSPYEVVFNVKAPNKDCQVMAYLCNYTAAWESLIYSDAYVGADMEKIMEYMITTYGVHLNSASAPDLLVGINSDEGYDMVFPSWEGRESTLVFATYNEDEKLKIFSQTARALDEQPAVRQESELFDSLLGEWNGTFTYKRSWEITDPAIDPTTSTFESSIICDPGFGTPEKFDSSNEYYEGTVAYYVEMAEENGIADPEEYAVAQVEGLFQEFKEMAAHYKQKYRDQNRIVIYGMAITPDYTDNQFTPWELFNNLNYSSYNVEQIFREYGPKMFLSIDSNDKIQLETNTQYIAPFLDVATLTYNVGAISPETYNSMFNEPMPVTLSDDGNTFTIEPIIYDADGKELELYCSTYFQMSGQTYASCLAFSPMVFERNEGKATAATTRASRGVRTMPKVEIPPFRGNVFSRPFVPTVPFKLKEINKKTYDMNEIKAEMEAAPAWLRK